MRIAVVVKQVPTFTEMALDTEGRLIRAGLPLELNPYCRRAVSQAVELAAAVAAEAGAEGDGGARREGDGGARADGGARREGDGGARAAALRLAGPFDLILAGRNSVDADTGQVPPELAELLDLPFLTGVRTLHLKGWTVRARCEHDDGWIDAELDLPGLLSCAERL